jgi:Tfp pilus assembly protein FimT
MVPLAKPQKGFTLPELLSIIVILAVLTITGIQVNLQQKNREEVNALTISLAGWLEQVRKSALLGAGCAATINSSISADAVVASATATNPNTQITSSTACLSNTPLRSDDIAAISPNSSFVVTEKKVEFTPRGTVKQESESRINIVIRKQPSGPSSCISIRGLIGNITISKGDQCGDQETF